VIGLTLQKKRSLPVCAFTGKLQTVRLSSVQNRAFDAEHSGTGERAWFDTLAHNISLRTLLVLPARFAEHRDLDRRNRPAADRR
jgi:hypothetical protein